MIFKKRKRKDRYKIDLSEQELEQELNQKTKSNRLTFKMDNDDLPDKKKQSGSNEKRNASKVRKRCAVCLDQIENEEEVFVCNYCGTALHHACMNYGASTTRVCPNCKKKIDKF
ncbi:MAG: hypothetical protein JSV88_21390 [Candidatus Aminicenantes bacterium]|nr:MAG: hypothetical protein JSV88_21390 [Candidatus Aminicenantes bacterium]